MHRPGQWVNYPLLGLDRFSLRRGSSQYLDSEETGSLNFFKYYNAKISLKQVKN